IFASIHTTSVLWGKRTHTFNLADIGEGITECEIIKWHVSPKSSVDQFDLLCEVQSDKATVEITSPFDGVVTSLLVPEGKIAKVGSGLCTIEVESDSDEASDSVPEPSTIAGSGEHAQAINATAETGGGSSPTFSQRKRHPMDPEYSPVVDVLAMPSVRHFARRKGVDINDLAPGSGKGGRIEMIDVGRALEKRSSMSFGSKVEPQTIEEDIIVEFGRTRHEMWKAMTKSLTIPHFGYSTSLDVTRLNELLPVFNENIPPNLRMSEDEPRAVSNLSIPEIPLETVPDHSRYSRLKLLPILIKFLAISMQEWPLFRSSITPGSDETRPSLTVRPHADISVALSTPTGLYTPTLQRVDSQSAYQIAAQLKHIQHLGRQTPCALTPKEMPRRGGTLTVSNIGAIGKGESAAPLLVDGCGIAIVVLGRTKWTWDVDSDAVGRRRLVVPVSWAADHRVVEGAELAAFVECWRGYVEHPERLICSAV
ncbi:CoA-dependent acyltransferase, partial [Fistulina hepatica ATCC 64428]